MFKMKNLVLTAALLTVVGAAQAFTFGTVDLKKVEANYAFAKSTYSEIDDRALEMQRYMVDKEKEYKKLESPVKQKEFEDKIAKEFKVKEENFVKYKLKKQQEVYDNIISAIKQVAVEQKIDSIVDYRVIYTGGVDVTDKVIKTLNSKK